MKRAYVGPFVRRQFDKSFAGTKLLDCSPEQFEQAVNELLSSGHVLTDGYAPFCKHIFACNWTSARQGALAITAENAKFLRSGYKSRTPQELPVLERWFEGVEVPVAGWLDIILYTAEQIRVEGDDVPEGYDCEVLAILGLDRPEEPPMPPITAMRNALGTSEGGSGLPLDREYYAKCVDYWSRYATVL